MKAFTKAERLEMAPTYDINGKDDFWSGIDIHAVVSFENISHLEQ